MAGLQDSNSEGSGSEASEERRPNRWTGAPATWLSFTEQERGLAASLDELRNRDLSLHLYNAHRLKKRGRELQKKLDEGVKVDDPLAPDAERPFIPPKIWTAWPLPPNEVPRTDEKIGEEYPDEDFTFKRREIKWPSRELEDVLMAVAMKSAKEKFQAREWESEDEDQEGSPNEAREDEVSREEGYSIEDQDIDEDEDFRPRDQLGQAPKETFIPAISADDERSAEILRPTIRHNLSKLDELLTALHHARKICRRYSPPSEADGDSGNESAHSSKRSKGRPGNFDLAYRSKPAEEDVVVKIEDGVLRQKKGVTRRGRPPKQYPRLEGESNEDYLVRIARLQKKPLPSFAKPHETSSAPSRSPEKVAHVPRQNRAGPEEAAENHRRRLRLRDWSEVLGAAALVGFPTEALARAAQRCANLFGEGMVLRNMAEAPFGVDGGENVKAYQPDVIPDFDDMDEHEQETEEEEEEEEEESVDSDLEMEGGVHVDRFLRIGKRVFRGPDLRTRKKPRREKKSRVEEEEDETKNEDEGEDGDGEREEEEAKDEGSEEEDDSESVIGSSSNSGRRDEKG